MSQSLNLTSLKLVSDSDHKIFVYSFESPVGKIISAADEDYLFIVAFEDSNNCKKIFKDLQEELRCVYIEKKNNILGNFENEILSYFKGNLKNFTAPLKMLGSDFQKSVWEKLLNVPYGEKCTYSDIAKASGRPGSHARAVGAACGANPLVIIIPCHRIVATGSNGGYSCGLDRKEKLLQLEEKYT